MAIHSLTTAKACDILFFKKSLRRWVVLHLKLREYCEEDREFLAQVWSESFYDPIEHRERFFDEVLPSIHCIVGVYYRKPRAALFLIPAELCGYKAFYLYGLSIDSEYRGLGIATAIMKRLYKWCGENDCLLYVNPNSGRLFRFFKYADMQPALYYSFNCTFDKKATPKGTNMIIKDISDDEYLRCRREYLKMNPGVTLCEPFMRFGLQDFRNAGGRVVRISYGYARFAALLDVADNMTVLHEALACDEVINNLLPYLKWRFNTVGAAAISSSRTLSENRFAGLVWCPNGILYKDICNKYTGESKCSNWIK